MIDPERWTIDDVGNYLENNNFQQYRKLFCEENKIDGRVFITLAEDDLKKPPLNIQPLGDLRRLCFLLESLREEKSSHDQKVQQFSPPSYGNLEHLSCSSSGSSPSTGVSLSDSDDDSYISRRRPRLDRKRFALSVLYMFTSHFLAGLAVTYAQEHLPDKKKYPPLRDFFLDVLPYVPWAYRVTEGVIMALAFSGLLMLFFHKHRFFVIQRLMIIAATVYLLRSLCVISTSIPMPQKNYNCDRLIIKSGWDRFSHVVQFYAAIGMKSNGIKTCGDYVFSGHTVIIILLVLSINEYTPRNWLPLHTLNWIVGVFGIFFILLGHGHYTLDIILAIAISSKLFSYHHTFANNICHMKRDIHRMKKCFPVFYFFEHEMEGYIPQEYEWPLPRPTRLISFYKDVRFSMGSYMSLTTRPKHEI